MALGIIGSAKFDVASIQHKMIGMIKKHSIEEIRFKRLAIRVLGQYGTKKIIPNLFVLYNKENLDDSVKKEIKLAINSICKR